MILGERYYKMSNATHAYGLTPVQHTVYSYIVCASGQKGYCWPAVKTVAANSGCSEATARRTLHELENRKFIRIESRYRDGANGKLSRTSNRYTVLDLPPLGSGAASAKQEKECPDAEPLPF